MENCLETSLFLFNNLGISLLVSINNCLRELAKVNNRSIINCSTVHINVELTLWKKCYTSVLVWTELFGKLETSSIVSTATWSVQVSPGISHGSTYVSSWHISPTFFLTKNIGYSSNDNKTKLSSTTWLLNSLEMWRARAWEEYRPAAYCRIADLSALRFYELPS